MEWQTASSKKSRSRRKPQNDDSKNTEVETIETPNPDLLDPIFQKGEEKETQEETLEIQDHDEDGWLTVTDKRKKKSQPRTTATPKDSPEETTQKKKRKRKGKKKKPSLRRLAEEDDEQDQERARYDLKKGDRLEVYSGFDSAWLKATVESAYKEDLTIKYYSLVDSANSRIAKFKRFSDEIRPIKDKQTGYYYPLPPMEEELEVAQTRKDPTKKKNKRKKKNAVKKASTKEELHALINNVLINQGPVIGMVEIANQIKENLNGGSWSKYKKKFGSMKKFLSAQENFEVTEENGQIMVRRLVPEPEPTETIDGKKPKVSKANGQSSCSTLIYIVCIVIFPIVAAIGFILTDDEHKATACKKASELSLEFVGEDLTKRLGDLCQ